MEQRAKSRRSAWWTVATAVTVGLFITGLVLMVIGLQSPSSTALATSESPRPTLVAVTPSPSVSLSVTPSAQPTAKPVASGPLTLKVPSAGISGVISDYTPAMIDKYGNVDPATLQAISLYTGITGCELSLRSINTCYIYGHSWIPSNPAVFNNVKDMRRGDMATISGGADNLYYKVVDTFTVKKPDMSSDGRVTMAVPGRVLLISCYRPVGYSDNLATVDNVIAVLQLVTQEPFVGRAFE